MQGAICGTLGSIGNLLLGLQEADIPMIQCLVVNKKTGVPGSGFAEYAAAKGKQRRELDEKEKKAIVAEMHNEIFQFDRWDWVLEQLHIS
jgi:hypothetical protein